MRLSQLIGLKDLKEKAQVVIKSCLKRDAAFPHTLLTGPGGLGKTAVARAIAEELDCYFDEFEAIAVKTRADITRKLVDSTSIATLYDKRLLLFADEVHRWNIDVQETMYYPMKEFRLTTKDGTITLPEFTFIAATTREDLLDQASFAARFSNHWKLRPYNVGDIASIVLRSLHSYNINATSQDIIAIARRCLGNPRLAIRYAEMIRDQVLADDDYELKAIHLDKVFTRERIDHNGLNEDQIKYMKILGLAEGPRGLALLASALGMHVMIVESIVEPPLIFYGLVDRTPSGRVLTEKGKKYVGI